MDDSMSILLPALGPLVATAAVLLATRLWKRPKSRARGSRRGRAAPGAPGEENPPHDTAGSPPYIPCGCGPGCTPCATAARELQDLVTPLWPGTSFPRDSEMWRLSWEDLEQLLERGHLPCCASSSSSGRLRPSRSLGESCRAPGGEEPADRSRCCSLGAAGGRRNCPSLRMHVAKKNLEVKLRAQPVAVRRSREQLVRRDSSESLPRSQSPGGSCQAPDGEDTADSSRCSPGIGGTRSALRMHVAKKSLEVKLGARPAPVRSSQQQAAHRDPAGSWERRCPTLGSRDPAALPCSQSEEILRRQRELEFPHLRGAPPRQMRLLLAAQILLRMLCFK